MGEAFLHMKDITKSFNKVTVLNRVDFQVHQGEVHALVGENGAGKSTLMKVLTGVYQKDQGEIMIQGEAVDIGNPMEAKDMGISIVHQELSLISSLSIMENIFLGREDASRGFIDYNTLKQKAEKILKELEADLDPLEKVSNLTIAEKQVVEIAKALSVKAKILVLDEPTSSLSQKEISKLFDIINKLKAQNVSVVYISHHLDEIFRIADRITILRDGEKVYTGEVKVLTENDIIRHMVGREVKNLIPAETRDFLGDTVLEVKNLTKKDKFYDINFKIRAGEVVGFAGLVGAGRSDIAKALFGLEKYDEGEILYYGKPVRFKNSAQAADQGIAYVPEDRRRSGLLLKSEIYKNITLKYLDRSFQIDSSSEMKIASDMVAKLKIKCKDIYQKARELSGGNQQKVVLSKWLYLKPKLLILDEPTRGIDVNAKLEIYHIIRQLTAEGVAIILISSEMPEILSLSDKIEVVRGGKIVKELKREEATQEKVMYYAVGGTN